ncbi:AMP-binding protein [Roseomonas sp. CCTCC AB2023176]|uniref:AMP-binding protein n=1 Tax=Roseomonas sp. CCTCC AB2023176 TaxID=3342640 RepID=UPI0035E31C05
MQADPTFPLVAREGGAVIAHRGDARVTVAAYLGDVAALADRLPAVPCVLNLCADRYLALVAFGAALSRGITTLLSADRSAHRQRELAARYPAAAILCDDAAADRGPLPLVRVRSEGVGRGPNPAIPADLIAAIGFTSGSTGEPAAHEKPWGALVAGARAAARRFGLDDPSLSPAVIATVPPQHMYGFETTMALPLHGHAAVTADPYFFPVEVAESLARTAAAGSRRRVLVTTPLQLRAFVAAGMSARPDAVISATAPLAPALAAEAEAAWSCPVLEIYGATEVGSVASRRTLGGEAWTPYDGVAFRAAGEDTLVTVPGLPEEVPLADNVALAPDGTFRLLGRRADLVKRGGKRASLGALNRLLAEVEGVQDGTFFAPDDLDANPSARLAAFVVAPGRTAAQIVAALRNRVEAVFLPRPVVLLDALPRDAVGKLSRRRLAALRDGHGEEAP